MTPTDTTPERVGERDEDPRVRAAAVAGRAAAVGHGASAGPQQPQQHSYPATSYGRQQDPWVGRTITGKYKLMERLGAGGMGTVYRAQHMLLEGRFFAIKLLHPEFSLNPEARARFLREGEILLSLHHQSIVSVRDLGFTQEGQIYLCLDYCDGVPLSAILRRRGCLAPADALKIADQILDGMVTAHKAGIIHRDLKPENIIVGAGAGEDLKISILDFGIAQLGDSEGADLTRGMIIGTPRYMSPEQAWGRECDARSDLYSVGLILYEMLAGRPAISASSTRKIIERQRQAEIDPLDGPLRNHPWRVAVEQLLGEVLVEDPDRRIGNAALFQARVRSILAGEGAGVAPGVPRKRKSWWVEVLLVALLGTSCAIFWEQVRGLFQGSATSAPTEAPRNTTVPIQREPAQPTAKARPHQCPLCGYRAENADMCPIDGVRLTPVDD